MTYAKAKSTKKKKTDCTKLNPAKMRTYCMLDILSNLKYARFCEKM